MRFETALRPDEGAVLRALGYGAARPDAQTALRLRAAGEEVARAARPRWAAARWSLRPPSFLEGANLALPGRDIARHLRDCDACFLLAVTLGGEVERATRAAEATDMAAAVLMDAAASQLAEQYADEAERLLRQREEDAGRYLTGRYAPGYGDVPLDMQKDVLRLLDAAKAIGLTAAESGILLPRKSITAVLGAAGHPVAGRWAGCENCVLRQKCEGPEEGGGCGRII